MRTRLIFPLATLATLSIALLCFGQSPVSMVVPIPKVATNRVVRVAKPPPPWATNPICGFDFAGWPTTNVYLLVQMATNLTPPVYWVDVTNGSANGHWHKAHWPTNEVLPQRFYRVVYMPKLN